MTPTLPPLPHWCEPGSPFAQQMQAYAAEAVRAAQAEQAKPLTDAQIEAISGPWAWENLNCSEHLIAFARAIERAHGICKASE